MDLAAHFEANQRYLWGLCYRMTGSAADAEDLVQDTFVRALEDPPTRAENSWRAWLVKLAMNLSLDHLRRRKSRPYVGEWLPSPIDTGDEHVPPAVEPDAGHGRTTGARYEMLESVSYAFLIALEALSPAQRAVLLLRDVFDYSIEETAEALDMSEADVGTVHSLAREAMAQYERRRQVQTRELQQRTQRALAEFFGALVDQDMAKMESLLSPRVRAVSDGGGQFRAGLHPIAGVDEVVRLFASIMAPRERNPTIEFRMFNGMPAVLVEMPERHDGEAGLFVLRCDLDAQGRIAEFHAILASDKLTGLRL